MKPSLALLWLLVAVIGACAPRFDPDSFAQRFFDHGRKTILAAVEDQNLAPAQHEQASQILDKYERTTVAEIAAVLRSHQDLMLAIGAGGNSGTLANREQELHRRQEQALRSLGRMHEELETSLGPGPWKAVTVQMEQKMSRYFRRAE
jgi:siroheme synthase (precorrin-2 oxidase/ferrochelatase)